MMMIYVFNMRQQLHMIIKKSEKPQRMIKTFPSEKDDWVKFENSI